MSYSVSDNFLVRQLDCLRCTIHGTLRFVVRRPQLPVKVEPQLESLERQGKRVRVVFYRTEAGGEPVREWLKELSHDDRKRIGEDIKTVEFGWPIRMPVCKPMGGGIYEVRTSLVQNRIARALFYMDTNGRMVLLHGFIKKTPKAPAQDLHLARSNKNKHELEVKRRGRQ